MLPFWEIFENELFSNIHKSLEFYIYFIFTPDGRVPPHNNITCFSIATENPSIGYEFFVLMMSIW